ncbi:hypothetical protein Tco_0360321, partial [Tanacetum coccineum]
ECLEALIVCTGNGKIVQFYGRDNTVDSKNLLDGVPAQSVESFFYTDVLDSPCLLVLVTGTSQSRQHGKSGSDSYYLSVSLSTSFTGPLSIPFEHKLDSYRISKTPIPCGVLFDDDTEDFPFSCGILKSNHLNVSWQNPRKCVGPC